ncbi:acyl-CoA N-acyltransferase [Coniophora puteana RWD-64-598 SS2]|uniref:Acyl-CoA N-acyltransferase n=1 Tax=Coniophora puteana (strain RWD-64-598) TaxID=741705 RepID=R7SDH4_CONPW|nr:acyl-CoA N-acyltransferase [Coniophora puteana RWD-64-598 SS2]EIW74191.1 acyl-CoA N-acyltransferase [Coniophora puteana RWD-64-598 SS2]
MEDINANFAFPLRELENERVKLTPLQPAIYKDALCRICDSNPQLFDFLPFGGSPDSITALLYERIGPDPGMAIYAIIDKTRPADPALTHESSVGQEGAFAGVFGWLNASAVHLKVEMGFAVVFPAFQRTHIATNAVGLMLQYALELPSAGGLGLRRVQWQAHTENAASIRLAERMGFVREGTLRWDRVLRDDKVVGMKSREGDPHERKVGRHSAMLAICWDDWEREKERVLTMMDRKLAK